MEWKEDVRINTKLVLYTLGMPAFMGTLRTITEKDGRFWFRANIEGDEMPTENSLFEIQLFGEKQIWRTDVTITTLNENMVVGFAERPLGRLQRREHFRVIVENELTILNPESEEGLREIKVKTLDMSVGGIKAHSKQTEHLVKNKTYDINLFLPEQEPLELKAKILSIDGKIFTLEFEGIEREMSEAIFQHVWVTQRSRRNLNEV